jgi:DNA-binding HxlR family transcriptional regulator
MKTRFGCPVRATIDLVSGKWKVQILWHLSFGPKRFSELRKVLPGVSEKVLTTQLRQLEAGGVLARKVNRVVPPQVTYFLNKPGEQLIPLMQELCDWGSEHFGIEPTMRRPPQLKNNNGREARRANS